jgi:hypothetical protein
MAMYMYKEFETLWEDQDGGGTILRWILER